LKKPAKPHIYLPNEIFSDLQENIDNSRQVAFAYSYVYYITYLYRYCKYIDDNGLKVTQDRIKEYLGYAPNNKKVNYIIKKDGILDSIGYTMTTTDYPISYYFDDDIILFNTITDFKDDIKIGNNRNFKVKIPLRAFHRSTRAVLEDDLTGTFYQVENTHRIYFEAFQRILENPHLGVVAFYIYGYLRHKTDLFSNGYQRSSIKLGSDLKMSDKTVRKYVDSLEMYGFLDVDRQIFDQFANPEDYEANIYKAV
jgi:hypothetical protein